MHCPRCSSITLIAANGAIPVAEDVLYCTLCGYELTQEELQALEDELVAKPLKEVR